MARIATRLRMTEGQLYTTVLAALAVALLSLTGLPEARQPTTAEPATTVLTTEAP